MDSRQAYDPALDQMMSDIPDIEKKLNELLFLKDMPVGSYITGREKLRTKREMLIADFNDSVYSKLEKYGLLEPMSLCEEYLENESLIKKTNNTILLINISCALESGSCYPGYMGMGAYYANEPFYKRLDGCEKKKEELEEKINGMTGGNLEKALKVYEAYKEFM